MYIVHINFLLTTFNSYWKQLLTIMHTTTNVLYLPWKVLFNKLLWNESSSVFICYLKSPRTPQVKLVYIDLQIKVNASILKIKGAFLKHSLEGSRCLFRVLRSVEKFDPKSGSWQEVRSMSVARMALAAVKYRDYIWVAGGMTGEKKRPVCKIVECYNSKTNE